MQQYDHYRLGDCNMKTLYLECGMGAAGDMLTAALLELMPDPEAAGAVQNGRQCDFGDR